jgi:hypothetical protein
MSKYVFTMSKTIGEVMLNFMEMSPKEAQEAGRHFLLYEFADLCLSQGVEFTLDELTDVINKKLDNLEPV